MGNLRNWSDHHLTIESHSEGKFEVYQLKKADTNNAMVKITVFDHITVVTGDFNHWMFYKRFNANAQESTVDHQYWCQKLETNSTQQGYQYDAEATKIALQEAIDENYGGDPDEIDDELNDYLEDCINRCDDPNEYKMFAYQQLPSSWGYENIIYETKINPWLEVVFDAMNEILSRVKSMK